MDSEGSDYIFLVREFLRMTIESNPACKLQIDFVGPSPFHGNFTIIRRDKKSSSAELVSRYLIELNVQKLRGYDRVTWTVDADLAESEAAIQQIMEDVVHEADLYYEIQQSKSTLYAAWEVALASTREAVHANEESSRRAKLKAYFKRSDIIHKAQIAVSEFIMTDAAIRSEMRRDYDRHTPSDYGGIIEYTKREIESLETFPGSEIRAMLQFVEGRHRHFSNGAVAVISAALGALIGGLSTIYAQWLWH